MKNLAAVFILLMFTASCNPVKKIARQQEQFNSVMDEYIKNHPIRIDTATKYLQGATITKVVERTDTILQYRIDTLTGTTTVEYIFEKGKDIHHYRVDTVTKIIVPTQQIELLKKLNEKLTTDKNEALLKAAKNKNWFYLFIIASIVAVLLLITTIKKYFYDTRKR